MKKQRHLEWTESELAVLRQNTHATNEEMATLLPGRTESAINNKRKAMRLGRTAGLPRRLWSDEELQFMRANPQMTDAEMARALGVRLGSLSTARKKADIRKAYMCVKCGVSLGSQGKWCSEHNTAARRWSQYANKAKSRGLDFGLTHDDLHQLLDENCTYCGGDGGGIDRQDSSKGYVLGNVTPCCWRCNAMKNDMPLDEWLAHMKKILSYVEGRK